MLYWSCPPACTPARYLDRPPDKARVVVAGLVLVRQRPGTAKGVIFVTLEDETGVVNVVVWAKVYEAFRRQIIAGRLLRVTGRVQRDSSVTHVVAEHVEDLSHMLDALALGAPPIDPTGPTDEAKRPVDRPPKRGLNVAKHPRAFHPRDQARAIFPGRLEVETEPP